MIEDWCKNSRVTVCRCAPVRCLEHPLLRDKRQGEHQHRVLLHPRHPGRHQAQAGRKVRSSSASPCLVLLLRSSTSIWPTCPAKTRSKSASAKRVLFCLCSVLCCHIDMLTLYTILYYVSFHLEQSVVCSLFCFDETLGRIVLFWEIANNRGSGTSPSPTKVIIIILIPTTAARKCPTNPVLLTLENS